jgi:hypothetical protein
MNWYYAENNERRGPVDGPAFDALIRAGRVRPDSLVWREGMAAWQSLAESGYTPAGAPGAAPPPAAALPPEMGVCSESGRVLPRSELVEIEGRLVSAEYKNIVLQRIREGVSSGGAVADPEVIFQEIQARGYGVAIGSCIGRAFSLVKRNFWLAVGGTFLAYLALMAASAIPLAGFLVQGPLIAGIYWLLLRIIRGEAASVGDAFQGFSRDWGHLVAASIVSGLLVVPALLPGAGVLMYGLSSGGGSGNAAAVGVGVVLIFLGFLVAVYLTVGWVFALPLIIDKRIPFWPAMGLSRRVVGMHWWQVFGMLLVTGLVVTGLIMVGILVLGLVAGGAIFGLGDGDPSAGLAVVLPLLLLFFALIVAILPVAFGAIVWAYEDIFGAPARGGS